MKMMEDLIGMITKHLSVGERVKIVGLGFCKCGIVLPEWAGILQPANRSRSRRAKRSLSAPPRNSKRRSDHRSDNAQSCVPQRHAIRYAYRYLFIVADLATLREPKRDVKDRVIFPQNFTEKIAERGRVESGPPRFGVQPLKVSSLRFSKNGLENVSRRSLILIRPSRANTCPQLGCWFDPH